MPTSIAKLGDDEFSKPLRKPPKLTRRTPISKPNRAMMSEFYSHQYSSLSPLTCPKKPILNAEQNDDDMQHPLQSTKALDIQALLFINEIDNKWYCKLCRK